jgi:hypothetical protein
MAVQLTQTKIKTPSQKIMRTKRAGKGVGGVSMVEILRTHVCKWKSETTPQQWGGGR